MSSLLTLKRGTFGLPKPFGLACGVVSSPEPSHGLVSCVCSTPCLVEGTGLSVSSGMDVIVVVALRGWMAVSLTGAIGSASCSAAGSPTGCGSRDRPRSKLLSVRLPAASLRSTISMYERRDGFAWRLSFFFSRFALGGMTSTGTNEFCRQSREMEPGSRFLKPCLGRPRVPTTRQVGS